MNAFERFFKTGSTEVPTDDEAKKIEEGNFDKRVKGKIFKVSPKGFGFIISKDMPFTRIFFHWTSLNQNTLNFTELRKGMEVEFTPIELEDKGCRAYRIQVLQ